MFKLFNKLKIKMNELYSTSKVKRDMKTENIQ